jgi:hypothetical protein
VQRLRDFCRHACRRLSLVDFLNLVVLNVCRVADEDRQSSSLDADCRQQCDDADAKDHQHTAIVFIVIIVAIDEDDNDDDNNCIAKHCFFEAESIETTDRLA